MSAPIPVHVVAGPLGSGKTTAIAKLLAAKPVEQNWVVLLNEFSDAGIDALTVASAARGAFDVRLIPGGCLCCAGEQDFRRNLQELIAVTRPDRIVIEPSGLGHPGGLVDELLGHEARGALRLAGIVTLLDPRQLRDGALAPGSDALAQVEIADSLALSKPDLAEAGDHERFATLVAAQFPPKAWSGALQDGAIPAEAFEPRTGTRSVGTMTPPALHRAERHAADAAAGDAAPENAAVGTANGLRREAMHLGHRALSWVFPRAVEFSRRRLESFLSAGGGASATDAAVARLKGVFRIADDDWVLAQSGERFVDLRPTSWRRDSRVEVLLDAGAPADVDAWDAGWLGCQRR